MAVDYISIEDAARELGISVEAVRCCMAQNSFPVDIGFTWKARHGEQRNYRISRKRFERLMEVLGEKREK